MFNAWFEEAKQAMADIAEFAHELDKTYQNEEVTNLKFVTSSYFSQSKS